MWINVELENRQRYVKYPRKKKKKKTRVSAEIVSMSITWNYSDCKSTWHLYYPKHPALALVACSYALLTKAMPLLWLSSASERIRHTGACCHNFFFVCLSHWTVYSIDLLESYEFVHLKWFLSTQIQSYICKNTTFITWEVSSVYRSQYCSSSSSSIGSHHHGNSLIAETKSA